MILNETGEEYRISPGLQLEPPGSKFGTHRSRIAGTSRMCRHLHIPLQSGSNKILQDMNRRYSREYYYELLQGIAAKVPGVALTADVMVGFPE
jgi:tRNA A37 methylthiotransferase MiaB